MELKHDERQDTGDDLRNRKRRKLVLWFAIVAGLLPAFVELVRLLLVGPALPEPQQAPYFVLRLARAAGAGLVSAILGALVGAFVSLWIRK